jgi:hypothetical protein
MAIPCPVLDGGKPMTECVDAELEVPALDDEPNGARISGCAAFVEAEPFAAMDEPGGPKK